LLRDVRPDIVQIEEAPHTQAAAVTTAMARRLSLPTVAVVSDSIPASGSIMQRRYARQTLRGASGLIAANGVVAGRFAEFGTTRPLAVIADRAVRPPLQPVQPADDAFVIGFAGRLVPERGLDILFQACVSVHGIWHLNVVGSGPEQERLENLAERLGIAARVSWVGGRPASEWHEVWPTLHCLVVPSRTTDAWYDTGGHHVLEAMAHGVPVVAARSGVLPDIVGEGGITVAEDDPAGLAEALRELQQHPDRRRSLAQAARRRVLQEFTEEVLARKTIEFWRRVSSGSDAASP
jgi:glycosyltransferase involved in cell wall biosynthesis